MSVQHTANRIRYKNLWFLGYEEYRIGDDGSFWTKSYNGRWNPFCQWRRIRPIKNPRNGYLFVRFWDKVKKQRILFYLHRLVLLAFVGPCPKGMLACHFPDRDKTNNRLDNLRWGTPKENQDHRKIHGTTIQGEKIPWSILTESDVRKIRLLWKFRSMTQKQIAIKYGVSIPAIKSVVKGRNWKHLA